MATVLFVSLSAGLTGGGEDKRVKAELFALRDVCLTGGLLGEHQERNRVYLLKLEPDRMLSWFRREAGLEPKAPPYRGWETQTPLLPGHILGFYMSGASMTVQATGDAELRKRLDYIVDQLAEIQAAHKSGYMFALPGGKAFFADVARGDIRIAGLPWNGYQINGVFAPIYTINKLLLGLYQVYLATDNEKAGTVFLKLADWFGDEVIDQLNDSQVQTLLQCEHGSLHESYVDAYTISGEAKYIKWARRLCHERMLGPLAQNQRDFLTHFHANANIPKYTGFEHIYRVTGEAPLHAAAMNFWNEVTRRRSWVIGGNSAGEHFFDPNGFENALHKPAGPESCNSVNMLRLTEALFRTEPSTGMMDVYERVLFNHILPAHENERGMFAYYTPMFPGAYRVYSDEFDSMWCCVATGLEVPGKYAQMIYTRSPENDSLCMNLFAASELNWRARGVHVRQTTGFPYEPGTTLRFDCAKPEEFTLKIRHPAWVDDGKMEVRVNGQLVPADSKSGSDAAVRRVWQSGDVVRVELPMQLTAERLPGCKAYAAFLYGPVVLSGRLGTGGLTKNDFWQTTTTTANKPVPEGTAPKLPAQAAVDPAAYIRAVEGKPLHFRLCGRSQDVELVPFFENYFERYAVYWHLLNSEEDSQL